MNLNGFNESSKKILLWLGVPIFVAFIIIEGFALYSGTSLIEALEYIYRNPNDAHFLAWASLAVFISILVVIIFGCKPLKSTDNETFGLLCSALLLFFAQILITNRWPPEGQPYNHVYGLVKMFLTWGVGLAPIGLSIHFCNNYWNKMVKEVQLGQIGESIYPTLMVAQGTFYTFVGVSAILMAYNGSKNDTSMLLAGLKLAFITSVIGLIYSIAAKIYLKKETARFYASRNRTYHIDEYDFMEKAGQLCAQQKNMLEYLDSIAKNVYGQRIEMSETLTKLVETQAEQNRTVSQNLVQQLSSMNSNILNSLQLVLAQTTKGIEKTFAEIDRNMAALNKNLAEAKDSSVEFTRKIEDSSLAYAKMAQSINDEYKSLVAAAAQKQEENLRFFYDKSMKMVDSAAVSCKEANEMSVKAFAKMLEEFQNNNLEAAVSLNEKIERFDKYADKMVALGGNMDNFSEKIAKLNDVLAERSAAAVESNIKIYDAVNKYSEIMAALEERQIRTVELLKVLDVAIEDIAKVDAKVKNSEDRIVAAFESLGNRIHDLNLNRSNEMIEEQKRYAANLHKETENVIKIIGEVVGQARENYDKKLQALDMRIVKAEQDKKEE